MNKYFICFIILLFNYVLNDDCTTNGDGTNCDRFTSGDSKCIPNLEKTGCEIAGGCGSGDAVPEGTITPDYCSNLKVTGSGKCIPNIAKTNCEIAPSCESGNAVPEGTITTDYCGSLEVGADELCVPNGDRSNCKIAESCTEVTTKATDSICKSLTVSDKDKKKCIKDGDKCIEKNKNESRALRFSLLLFIFTLLY